jgi:mono/diheme cytochrome c family protein/uncharacterized membrane protein
MLTGRCLVLICALAGLLAYPGLGTTGNSAGRELFVLHCAKCHGADGKGTSARAVEPEIPDFTSASWHAKRSDSILLASIVHGKGKGMPAFGERIQEDQARALMSHVRSLNSGKGKPGDDIQAAAYSPTDFEKEFQRLQAKFEKLQAEVHRLVPTPGGKSASERKKSGAGRELFLVHCAKCHGKDGTGAPSKMSNPEIPDFTDASWQARHSDAQLLKSILEGKGKEMPTFQKKLDKEKAKSLLAFVRAFSPTKQGDKKQENAPNQGTSQDFSPSPGPKNGVLDEPKEPAAALSCPEKLQAWLGKFHPPAVNFPIALLAAAALAEFLRIVTGRPFFDAPARFCLWIGAGTACLAALLGWFLAGFHLTDDDWVKTTHRWLGTSTAACALLLLLLSEISRRWPSGFPRLCYRLTLFGLAGLVTVTGYFGGALVLGLNHYAWPS